MSRFLAAFYGSGSTYMADYARGWAAGEPGRAVAGHGAELAARRTAAVLADYQRAVEGADTAERAMWGARVADALGYPLAGLDATDAARGGGR